MQQCQVLAAACANIAEQVLNHLAMMLKTVQCWSAKLSLAYLQDRWQVCTHFKLCAASSCTVTTSRFSQLSYMFIGYNYNSVFQRTYTPGLHITCK